MQISSKEYQERLQEYLKACGPNLGTSFFGKWGWYAMRKSEFDEMLRNDGITVIASVESDGQVKERTGIAGLKDAEIRIVKDSRS